MLRAPGEVLVHLRRARDLIDREYAEPLDLERLAGAAGLSRWHFHRLFTATYGSTPAAYLSFRRVERAQDLLRATNLSVTEVCHAVGFTSLGSFSSRFKEFTGETPRAYQQRWGADVGGPAAIVEELRARVRVEHLSADLADPDAAARLLAAAESAFGRVDVLVANHARSSAQTLEQIFQILGKLFKRQISAKGTFAGPLEIAKQSGEAARLGFKYLLQLMGFISISIAVMNLMPIPILDGGQIFILMVEGVIRRDLSVRLKEIVTQVGFVMILLLMFVVIWFDLMKTLPAHLRPGG